MIAGLSLVYNDGDDINGVIAGAATGEAVGTINSLTVQVHFATGSTEVPSGFRNTPAALPGTFGSVKNETGCAGSRGELFARNESPVCVPASHGRKRNLVKDPSL